MRLDSCAAMALVLNLSAVSFVSADDMSAFFNGEGVAGTFSLPALPGEPNLGPFAAKARRWESRTRERNIPWLGLIASAMPAKAGEAPSYASLSDAAIWTGIFVAAQAHRLAATGDPEALAQLESSLWGLHALHRITGVPGLIARVAVPLEYARAKNLLATEKYWHEGSGDWAEWAWRGHVSLDQYDGYLFGLAAGWPLIQDPKLKAAIREDAQAIAEHVMRNDMRVRGPDTFLDFRANYFLQDRWPKALRAIPTPPVRQTPAVHGLHLMKVCSFITGDRKIEDYYVRTMIGREELDVAVADYTGYLENLLTKNQKTLDAIVRIHWGGDVRLTPGAAYSAVGNNLQHLALADLFRLEEDRELREVYRRALAAAHEKTAEEGNSFWNLLYGSAFPSDERAARDAVETLRNFPDRPSAKSTRNSDDPSLPKYRGLHNNFFKRKGEQQKQWLSPTPLPIGRRVMHSDFPWQSNPYQMDGEGNGSEGSGTAYLIAYWMARSRGLIGPND
jgi:hypothetical protein